MMIHSAHSRAIGYWGQALLLDVSVGVIVYLWLFTGSEGAGYVANLALWVTVVLGCLSASMVRDARLDLLWRPFGFTAYHFATEAAIVGVLAWHGHMVLAVALLVPAMVFEFQRSLALAEYRNGLRHIVDNLVTVAGGAGRDQVLEVFRLETMAQEQSLSEFDMRYCTPFLAQSIFAKQPPSVVIFNHWKDDQMHELLELARSFPQVQFYASLSKHKSEPQSAPSVSHGALDAFD